MSDTADAHGVRIAYVSSGEGMPALVLHGAYSTRDEVVPVLAPLLDARGLRGVYPDLPGMGESTDSSARSTDDALDALDAVIRAAVGERPFVVVGHSFGGFLAQGVAARHPDRVRGIALVSPFVEDFEPAPERVVADDGATADVDEDVRGDYLGYFVVRTAATRAAFEERVRPALGRYDGDVVDRIMSASTRTPDPADVPFGRPVAILLGRDDAFIGWRAQQRLQDVYPRATVVVADGAGHALLHERPALVRAVLEDWLDRVLAD